VHKRERERARKSVRKSVSVSVCAPFPSFLFYSKACFSSAAALRPTQGSRWLSRQASSVVALSAPKPAAECYFCNRQPWHMPCVFCTPLLCEDVSMCVWMWLRGLVIRQVPLGSCIDSVFVCVYKCMCVCMRPRSRVYMFMHHVHTHTLSLSLSN